MKMKPVSIACALAVAGISGQALAIAPSLSGTAQVNLFVSGASAQQKSLGYIAETICGAGTLDVMYNNASIAVGPPKTVAGGTNHRAYFCTAAGTGTSIDGKKVLINDRAQGGSANGVLPVARSIAIAKMTVDGTCTAVMDGAVQARVDKLGAVVAAPAGSPLWSCNNVANAIPDGGVSDVEPAMFVGINKVLPTDADFKQSDANNLNIFSELAVVFGTPVTNDLGIANLTRSQITSIMTGNYQDWSQVDPTKTGPITICRRANGSGSQAANNAWFMNFPCGNFVGGNLNPATAANSVPGGFTVIENASAGAVLTCLNTHAKAIGVLGTETQPTGADTWHFVTIDNQAPTVANAATGKYDFYVEQSIQWRNKTVGAGLAPNADQTATLATIRDRSGDPTFLANIPGTAALWINGYVPSIPFDPTNPVMQGSRFTNTCTPTTLQF